jgi:hypothetical protein
MFQFTRNNQTFKCSPIILEGFDGDDDNGFICTNTKQDNIENFENDRAARFVRIDGGGDYLQLSQVVVKDLKGDNVAKGKNVSSSGVGWDGREANAVDGVESSRGHPRQYHSNGGNAFFEIDLGALTEISTIVVYNRADCCQGRLASGYKVKLLNANRNVVFTSNNLNGDASQTIVVKPPVFEKIQCPAGQVQSGFSCYPPFLINK